MSLHHPLRTYRRAKNLTLEQLSQRSKVHTSTICRIERGLTPSREQVIALARGMRVEPSELERALTSEGHRVA
jgi:transcriptional regulator with XRE-family HTH domain